MVGLIASDGNLYQNNGKNYRIEIDLQICDADILEKISELIYEENKVRYEFDRNRARFFLYGKDVFDLFSSYGLTPKKSETLNIDFSKMPQKYFHHFLRGYIDGDGTFMFKSINKVHLLIVGNHNTMHSFKDLVKTYYGLHSDVYKINSNLVAYPFYRFAMQRTPHAKAMINILYGDATIFLQRKRNTIQEILVPFNTGMC